MTATRGFALFLTLIMTGAATNWSGVAAGAAAVSTAQLRTISARPHAGGTSLVVETTEPTAYVTSRPDPLTILLDLRNVEGARVVPAVSRSADNPIAGVAVEATEALGAPVSRIRVTLARPTDYQVRSERNTIVIDLGRAMATPAAQVAAPAAIDPITALGLDDPTGVQGKPVVRVRPSQAQLQDAVQQPPAATTAITQVQSGAGRGRSYSGNPISLDFQGADLRSVLRMFSEISGLNIVIDPAVTGSVDVMLTDVPWDQALDIILRANKLGYLLDGTIVRIAPLTVLADEEGQRRKLTDEQALAGELHVLTKTLSYARAEDMQALITKSALSARGTVQVDPRTNTVIITDLQERLTTAESLLSTLDRPQPQVEIEARIVQTTKDFAKALGVNWGFNGQATPALGNTTNLAFPNSAALGGRTGLAQGPSSQPTAVNLGVQGASSAVGLALGSINGAFNLDVALSALERSGNGKLLSTPRVSTQNNIEAEITQGIQIPIQTVANNTVTVSFKDAALTLKVTPQITAAGTVIMKISVENAAPDWARQVNNIPPINTQRANTTVLLGDGQTTVIGGIYTSQEQMIVDRTPGLSRVPFLNWLFKRENVNDQSTELLIFITPRITKA
ncbi:MAG: type IV pilus secretin PilQ [Vicinamibacterales bacterium]